MHCASALDVVGGMLLFCESWDSFPELACVQSLKSLIEGSGAMGHGVSSCRLS